MAAITATTPTDARTGLRLWRLDRLRASLAAVGSRGTLMAGAVRHHDWSPALTISGLTCGVIGSWETFGRGAAWGAGALAFLLYDWSRDR